jgi:hypothetical protein
VYRSPECRSPECRSLTSDTGWRQPVPVRKVGFLASQATQGDLSRTQVKLRAKLNRLRAQADDLEAAANRPIEAATASDEPIARQYGDAGAGKNGEHK